MIIYKPTLLTCWLLVAAFASCKKAVVAPDTITGKNLVLSLFEQQKVIADNSFTLKLFKKLDSANVSGTNLFASPLSVSFALGMTGNGSGGQTLSAFNNTLNFNGPTQQQVNEYYNNLITNLPLLDPKTTVNIANSIWYRKGFDVLPKFLQTDNTYFHAKIEALDFNDPSSLTTINNWVSTKTNGKIPTIIQQVAPEDIMFLINAIYFKSSWKEKFDAAKTSKQPFYLAGNSQVQTDFMDGTVNYKRFDNNEVSVFELPYSKYKFSMVIAMPASGTPVQQLVSGLDSAKWQTWINGLHATKSELKLPKFKFSYKTSLKPALISMGLGIAFSNQADFSGINPTAPLQISDVLHKAFIDVNEDGTTAAAATAVIIGLTATANPPPNIIDHPFFFAIREVSSGLIVFAGVVNDPSLAGN